MEGLAVRSVITLRYFTSLIARADRTLSINRLMMAVTLTVNMTFIPFMLVFSVQLTNQSQVCVVPTIRIEHHSALQHRFPASSFEAKHPEQRASVSLGLTLPLCQTMRLTSPPLPPHCPTIWCLCWDGTVSVCISQPGQPAWRAGAISC